MSSSTEVLVCRVCRATTVHLHKIRNSPVQVVFEKLTSKKLTKDGRADLVCFLCYSLLRKCCRFLKLYQRTEDIFSRLYSSGFEVNQDVLLLQKQSNIVNLSTTPIHHVEVFPTITTHSTKQKEPTLQPVLVKKEQVEVKIECEYDCDALSEGLNEDNVRKNDHMSPMQEPKKHKNNVERTKKKQNTGTISAMKNFHICEICDKMIEKEQRLKAHFERHNLNREVHVCTECNTTFTLKNNLKRHIALKHASNTQNVRKHSCVICHKKFNRGHNLTKHMQSHTRLKPYSCPICNENFTSSSNVTVHVMEVHNNKKLFACNYCDKKYAREHNLQEHTRTHT